MVENEICRILIADDEPIERMVISKAVRNYFGDELEIVEAENGREAIARFWSRIVRLRCWIFPCRELTAWRRRKKSERKIRRAALFF